MASNMSNETLSTNETSQENATAENATTIKLNPNSFVMALNSTNFAGLIATSGFRNIISNGTHIWTFLKFRDTNNKEHMIISKINSNKEVESVDLKRFASIAATLGTNGFINAFAYLSPDSDKYILSFAGSFCDNETCSSFSSGQCIFAFDLNNQLKWSKCFAPYSYFTQGIIWQGKVYLIRNHYFTGSAPPNLLVLNEETGDIIVSKYLEYNSTSTFFDAIYIDSSGIYIGGHTSSGIKFVLKLDYTYNLIYAKELIDNSTSTYFIRFILGDDNYLYLITSDNKLWKIDKQTGNLIFVKVILNKCPYYCYYIRNGLVDSDALYFIGEYNYQSGDGQRVLKLDKNGNLIWATKIKFCDTSSCSDPVISISKGINDTIAILGSVNSANKDYYYLITLDKETGLMPGYEDYISNVTADDIGYEEENYEDAYIKDLDLSLFSFEDAYPTEMQPYPYYEEIDANSLVNATILFPSEEVAE